MTATPVKCYLLRTHAPEPFTYQLPIQVPFGQLPRYMLQDGEGYVLNPEGINLILKKKQIELLNNYSHGKKETQKPEEN